MADPTTHPGPPVDLLHGFSADPSPVADCDVCQALGTARTEARTLGDLSKVSDMNVEIRRHPHPTSPARRSRA